MTAYLDAVYPAVLAATAVLFLAGGVTMAFIGAHRALTWVVTGFYVVTAVEVVTVLGILIGGDVPVVITIGYVLAAVALLPLLGIARIGAPDAASTDPDRPILQPDQTARVDGAAAMIVAVAAAVVAWRIAVILGGAS